MEEQEDKEKFWKSLQNEVLNQSSEKLTQQLFSKYQRLLDKKYEEAKAQNLLLLPDYAMMECMDEILRGFAEQASSDEDTALQIELKPSERHLRSAVAAQRKAHHYAVDLFYSATGFIKRGRPQLSDTYLDTRLDDHEKGKSYLELAKDDGFQVETQKQKNTSKEKARGRIRTAKKRRG